MELKYIVDPLKRIYLAPTYSRQEEERENKKDDSLIYASHMHTDICGGTSAAGFLNIFLSLSALEIFDHFTIKGDIYTQEELLMPAFIASLGISLLTNLTSGIYEINRNRQNRKLVRQAEETWKDTLEELADKYPLYTEKSQEYYGNQNF